MANGTTVTIVLEIDGDDPMEPVEGALDSGAIQDAIREYASDMGYDCTITSAIVEYGE